MAIENLTGLSRPSARKALHFGCTSPRILFLRSSLSTISPPALPGSEHKAHAPPCSLNHGFKLFGSEPRVSRTTEPFPRAGYPSSTGWHSDVNLLIKEK